MVEQAKQQEEIPSITEKSAPGASVKIVLTANNHLGRDVPGQRRREERLQRLRDAFQQATSFAVAQGADLFIQAGDFFDTTAPDEQDRAFVAACLARLKQASIPVIALGGLHDTPSTSSALPAPQQSYARLGALHYFSPLAAQDESEPLFLEVHGERIGIVGIGWTMQANETKAHENNLFSRAEVERIVHVPLPLLILHSPIEGIDLSEPRIVEHQKIVPVKRDDIERQDGFRVLLDGYPHIYSRTRLGKTEVIAPGSTQSDMYDVRQADAHEQVPSPGFVYLGLAPDGLRWCRHIPVDALHFKQLTISLGELWSANTTEQEMTSSSETQDRTPTAQILRRLEPLCNLETMVRLRLEGEVTRNHYHQLDLNSIRHYGEQHCFSLAIDDSSLILLPDHVNYGAYDAHHTPDVPQERGERFSLREEVIVLADHWISDAAPNEQEQKMLRYVKGDVLAAIDSILVKEKRGAKGA